MGSRKTGQFVSHVFAYLLGALMAKVDQVIRFMRQLEEGYDYTKYEMPVGRNFLKPGASTQGRMGTFLADDDEEGDEWLPDQPETFIPTGMPVATVLPPMRTKGHTRSFVANPRTNRAVSCASTLERVCALSLIANAQVDEIEDQPASLYVGEGDDDFPTKGIAANPGSGRSPDEGTIRCQHILQKVDRSEEAVSKCDCWMGEKV